MTEVTGGDLLTLWKVGRVELPKIAEVYLDAVDALTIAREAAAAFFEPTVAGAPATTAGQVGPAWLQVCDELAQALSLCAHGTLGSADALGRAIIEHTGTDADGTGSPTEVGQDLWRRINDPNEIDPADPDQHPAAARSGRSFQGGQPAESGYLTAVTQIAESVKRLAIQKQKADDKEFDEFVTGRFQQYALDIKASWQEWGQAYSSYRSGQSAAAATSAPPRPESTRDSVLMERYRKEYDQMLEETCGATVTAFQAWAAHDPDTLTSAIAAISAVEERLGDGQAVRFANSAQINLASQWDGSYCTSLRNFLASFLIMPGNQQTIVRTLRELLEAEQALYRQAQGNMLQLAEKAEEAVKAAGTEDRAETKTFLTILSAVAWIAGAALAIPSGGASIYAGVVSFNAVAAVAGAAASLLPGGEVKSIGADKVSDVLTNVSQVMDEARDHISAREADVAEALSHNHRVLAGLLERSAETGAAGPVTPSRPTIVSTEAGRISDHLHPK